MSRKNIFEILQSKWDLAEEVDRLYRLFTEDDTITSDPVSARGHKDYNLKDFVDTYCFENWENRGRCIDVDDYLSSLDFDNLYKCAKKDIECLFTYIEIIYNFFQMASTLVMDNETKWKYYTAFMTLQNNMDDCLEHYNYEALYFDDKEQVLVIEKDPAVTAVVEISEPTLAYEIIQYNHYTLKGNIPAKKAILLKMGADLEPKRVILQGLNKALSQDIFNLLNNLNIRHNNCTLGNKNYRPYIAEMQNDELEEWYDELYQMLLLAMLELDNIDRAKKVAQLNVRLNT